MRSGEFPRVCLARAVLLLGLLASSNSLTQAANIYVTASGQAGFDVNLQRALESFGHSVTLGVPYDQFDGTQNLVGIDAVYLQVNYNWFGGEMPAAGQTALVNFVNQGGGLVTTEWMLWKMGEGFLGTLSAIIPVNPTSAYDELSFVTLTQNVADGEINEGLGSTVGMPLDYIDGTRTLVASTRNGASSFYSMDGGFIALAGWNVGSGRVLSFATTNGQAQLSDAGFQQLLSNSMNWVQQGPPVVSAGEVVNAASLLRGLPVAPGSLVSIFGSELASSRATAASVPLPDSLGGVSVTFNDLDAPLYFVSPRQINAQLPWAVLNAGATSGTASMVVRRGEAVSQAIPVQVGPVSPGIFSIGFGVGQAIASNEDGTLAAPVDSIPGILSQPARIGNTIIVLATGLGVVDPRGIDGQASLDMQRRTLATPTVLIGGAESQVRFSGLDPHSPGVYRITVIVPQITPGDRVPIQIRLGGITSTDLVTIAVRN